MKKVIKLSTSILMVRPFKEHWRFSFVYPSDGLYPVSFFTCNRICCTVLQPCMFIHPTRPSWMYPFCDISQHMCFQLPRARSLTSYPVCLFGFFNSAPYFLLQAMVVKELAKRGLCLSCLLILWYNVVVKMGSHISAVFCQA